MDLHLSRACLLSTQVFVFINNRNKIQSALSIQYIAETGENIVTVTMLQKWLSQLYSAREKFEFLIDGNM